MDGDKSPHEQHMGCNVLHTVASLSASACGVSEEAGLTPLTENAERLLVMPVTPLSVVKSDSSPCRVVKPAQPNGLRRVRPMGRKRPCLAMSEPPATEVHARQLLDGNRMINARRRLMEGHHSGSMHVLNRGATAHQTVPSHESVFSSTRPKTPTVSRTSCGESLFPLFRPTSEIKTVHLVRHGESEYNRAVSTSKFGEDLLIFDAPLTVKGQSQARALKYKLQTMQLADAVWVVSPLTRALQTFVLSCPGTPLLKARASDKLGIGAAPKIVVLPLIAEHLMTAGDVGRTPGELAMEFPQLAEQLSQIQHETWWYCSRGNNCSKAKCFGSTESPQAFKARVAAFRKWVQAQPERVVVAVGHSMFWRSLTGAKKTLKNCEVLTVRM